MKKILGLTVAALLIIGLVGGGTWAYFSDVETSSGNSLAAGTLDLNVDGGDSPPAVFTLTTLAPGDSGSGTTELDNVGSLSGELDVQFSTITNGEGANPEPETNTAGDGELGSNAQIAPYLDVNQDGSWTAGQDVGLGTSDNSTYTAGSLVYATIDSFDGLMWSNVATLANGATANFTIPWQIAGSVGNDIQGDNCTFNITFTLEQAAAD